MLFEISLYIWRKKQRSIANIDKAMEKHKKWNSLVVYTIG